MPTLGAGLAHWNNIDDSRWETSRVKVADLPKDSPSHEPGVVLHVISCGPPTGTSTKGTILLIHGFPQTSYQFRRVITPIADAGYRVIVPDYRGAGASSKPWNGYTKEVMAQDLHTLVKEMGVKDKIHVVGHDIGGMIAHAYAVQFPEDTASVAWGECTILGTEAYYKRKASMGGWHYTFHNLPDLPEALVQGREKIYLKHMYDRLAQNANAISAHDLEVYANAYSQPGALRAGFNCYRTFEQDGEDNKAWLQKFGKSKVPYLALFGAKTYVDEASAREMTEDFYENVSFQGVPGSGHWIAEEKPAEFVKAVLEWVDRN